MAENYVKERFTLCRLRNFLETIEYFDVKFGYIKIFSILLQLQFKNVQNWIMAKSFYFTWGQILKASAKISYSVLVNNLLFTFCVTNIGLTNFNSYGY